MVGARPATAGDDAALAELRSLARADAVDKRGGDALVDEMPIAGDGDGDEASVVGCIGDDVVGFAILRRQPTTPFLSALFTHPDARGVGVGHAMLAEVMRIAAGWGFTDLDSYALPGDRDTKNFFESHGMKSRLLIVRRSW